MEANDSLTCKINGKLSVPYRSDNGADISVIPRVYIEQLQPVETYPALVEGVLIAEQYTVNFKEAVKLTLILNTTAGPLTVRNVELHILEDEGTEVILGKPLLRQLGINVDGMLAQLAGREMDLQEEQEVLDKTMPTPDVQIGVDADDEVEQVLAERLHEAVKAGASEMQIQKLKEVLHEYKDVFRIKLGADPPVKIEPLQVHLKPDVKPPRAKPRKLPPLQTEFIRRRIKELQKFGLIYRNPKARYASPVHVVKKKLNPTWENLDEAFRWTGDFVAVNKLIDPIHWPMPDLALIVNLAAGAGYYQSFDLLKGFWSLPLHESSQELYSFIVEDAVYTPTRLVQGATDSALLFQSTMQDIFQDRYNKSVLIWIDDMLAFAKTFEDMLDNMRYILQRCRKFGLKINAKKIDLFATEAKFCGKILSASGIRHDPARTQILSTMAPPTTVGELQQFLCALTWMKTSLPDYSRLSMPLRDRLEVELTRIGKRTKRATKNVPLELTKDEHTTFRQLCELVAHAVELAHPDPHAQLVLMTDSSQTGWAGVLFQIPNYDATVSITDQPLQPLSFMGGMFRGSQKNWAILEKEAFAIIECLDKLSAYLYRPFILLTDNRNLTYIFTTNPDLRKPTTDKLQRWAMRLSAFTYSIEHIDGESNLWADLLSRWAQPTKTVSLRRLALPKPPLKPLATQEWPDADTILASQQAHLATCPPICVLRPPDPLRRHQTTNAVWIPRTDASLRLRLLVIAHHDTAGHRGMQSTTNSLTTEFFWEGLRQDVEDFCRKCLFCLQKQGGRVVPRPLGTQMHADGPNQVLHLDYIQLPVAYNGMGYVLVLKDGYSHFVELVPCHKCDAMSAALAIQDWYKRFGVVPNLNTDQGSHFKNVLIRELCRRWPSNHHFTTSYIKFNNGSVERVNRDLIAALTVIIHENNLSMEEWVDVLPVVQYSLNQAKVPSLGNHAPVEIFAALETSSALTAVLRAAGDGIVTDIPTSASIASNLVQLQTSMVQMHREVKQAKDKQQEYKQRGYHNRKHRKPQPANFEIGEFVLRANVDERQQDKLSVRWKGPFRIVDTISEQIYVIEHLVTQKRTRAHTSRLRYYHDSSLDVTEELLDQINRQGFIYEVDSFTSLRYVRNTRKWQVEVSWNGFDAIENSFEPIEGMLQQTPELLVRYLQEEYRIGDKHAVTRICHRFKTEIRKIMMKYHMDRGTLPIDS